MRESISSLREASIILKNLNEAMVKNDLNPYEVMQISSTKRHVIQSLKAQVLRLASMTKVLDLIQEYSKEVNGDNFEVFVDKGLLYVGEGSGEFRFPIKGFDPSSILELVGVSRDSKSHPVLCAYLETPEIATIIGAKMAIEKIKKIRGAV